MEIIACVLAFLVVLVVVISIKNKKDYNQKLYFEHNINTGSFTRYAQFFDVRMDEDPLFTEKVSTIIKLIDNKEVDVHNIASLANCSYEECILIIKYIENKRLIENYYIDEKNGIIDKCSEEDEELLLKYQQFIYYNHFQIKEMVIKFPNCTNENFYDLCEVAEKEIKYLYDKNLLNGIIYNDVDKTIDYYTIDKHVKEKFFISVTCPKCGATSKIALGSKKACDYCKYILIGFPPEESKDVKDKD